MLQHFIRTNFPCCIKKRVIVAILLIAVIVFIILKDKIKKIYLALFLELILGGLSFKIEYLPFEIKLDENASCPITHWIMMGLNEEYTGGYKSKDHDIAFNEPTKEAKKEANIKEINARIKNQDLLA